MPEKREEPVVERVAILIAAAGMVVLMLAAARPVPGGRVVVRDEVVDHPLPLRGFRFTGKPEPLKSLV